MAMKSSVFYLVTALFFFDVSCGQTINLSSGRYGLLITASNDSIYGTISIASDSESLIVVKSNGLWHVGADNVKKILFHSYEMISAIMETDMQMKLFRIIANGKLPLLVLQPSIASQPTTTDYYVLKENMAFPVVLNERQFFKIFDKAKKEMWDFAFSHDLDLNSERDIQSLFDYFNKQN